MSRAPGAVAALCLLAVSAQAVADGERELSLAEAVRIAIASDPDLYLAREEVRAADDEIALARAAFAPLLFGEVGASRSDLPPTSTRFAATDLISSASVGLAGRIETGLSYKLSAGLVREDRDDAFSTLYNPAITTTIRAEVVQPLWRGAFSAARKPIVVAALRKNRSEHELRARIEATVGAVQIAYWDLVRARSERAARASAVQIATEQVSETRGLRRLGTGSDLDILEAEAAVSRRQQELLRSEQDVVAADGRLFATLGVRAGEGTWVAGRPILPTDSAELAVVPIDVEAQLALARDRRADVRAARERVAAELAALEVTEDRRRAALDLVAGGGTAGFAGTLATTVATAGVNGGGLTPPYQTDPAYDGGLGTSVKNALGHDLNVFVGVRLEVPLAGNEADARHALQQRAVARARLAEHQTLARIESEVRTTVAQLALAAQQVEAVDRTVALSERLLDGTRKRFRAGAGTTYDVLRVSEELTRARIDATRARADYRVSLTRLATATGSLLDGLAITIQSLGPGPGPR